MNIEIEDAKIAIIGLGYVGLPLAVEFGKKLPTIGFDINQSRVDELNKGIDSTLECSSEELAEATSLTYTATLDDLRAANVYIVTVPTPIDEHKQPDLTPLIKASEALGKIVSKGDTIIYESTVYPGATEETCLPVVEKISGLIFNQDFFAGYSPERINPGDKEHRVTNILKVTSGSNEEVAEFVDRLYNLIITVGTHKAPSIKVAEASKVIENVQRDVNIALINELHQIFQHLNINTKDVIEAASTKWNFMKLFPGLVGGHCIGVDPYYLLHKSKSNGYVPDLMRTAREINDGFAEFLVNDFIRKAIFDGFNVTTSRIALLGFTFKENCPDIRNTKVYDVYLQLKKLNLNVVIVDPWASKEEVKAEYDVDIINELERLEYDLAFLAVGHTSIIEVLKKANKANVYDFKGLLNKNV